MASGWNRCVWLECIGVVSGCCCKEVYRYPHNITYPYSTCISSFLQQHPYSLVHLKNVFCSCLCYFCAIYSKCCSKNIRDCSKIEITQT